MYLHGGLSVNSRDDTCYGDIEVRGEMEYSGMTTSNVGGANRYVLDKCVYRLFRTVVRLGLLTSHTDVPLATRCSRFANKYDLRNR